MKRTRKTSRQHLKATRSRAAIKGWKTRQANARKRSNAARKGWKTRTRAVAKSSKRARVATRKPFRLKRERDIQKRKRTITRLPEPRSNERQNVDHMITFRFSAGGRSYRRDLVVPAPSGTSLRSLVRQARAELPDAAESLKPFLTPAHAEIIQGPATSRRRTELR